MISISIVEDHDFYRQSLVKVIEESSFLKISGVYSCAEEAMQELPFNAPDIAIVDIKLKLKSGIELIQKVKPFLANTQFLMCSGYQNDENIFNALKAGASGYIVKGSTESEIQNAIVELHNGGSPMSPYIARQVINLLYKTKTTDNNTFGLSSRELEVLSLLSQGLLYKEISDRLSISPNTVKNHCKNIYKRLHVQNKVEAINKFSNYNLQAHAS
ncbi:response regulator [Pedobacter fastidiosus]|uniref:Response regulator transcription factor n=1 Tax=Pedobacter fastidiosus TaxID=2765361 RepID=A0ABR7KVC5_9SPHI|nr:response regulator transcription factor [Pedobacter fastidiosus]MBC6112069.1 response regulator transcription factor [Pedobacter fastidiosus]